MGTAEFNYEIFIDADREKVWLALTTPEFTRQYWHNSEICSDFTVGNEVTFKLPDGSVGVVGKIIKCDQPTELSYTWRFTEHTSMEMAEDTVVTFSLEAVNGGTNLTVNHSGFDADDPVYRGISQGWPELLTLCKKLMETGSID